MSNINFIDTGNVSGTKHEIDAAWNFVYLRNAVFTFANRGFVNVTTSTNASDSTRDLNAVLY